MSSGIALKQVVAFRLANDLFAADIFSVERVLRYSEPRSIPGVPGWMEGVIDYHAKVVPVVDLRKRFELECLDLSTATRLLVLNIEGDLIAAIVDEVLDVMQLGPGRLSAPPPIFRGLSADFLLGMTHREERLVVVLDFGRIFSTTERLALEKLRDGDES